MELMISVILLLGAAVLGAWRLETDFDRETHALPVKESDYRSGELD
jgi:hypothetical protein